MLTARFRTALVVLSVATAAAMPAAHAAPCRDAKGKFVTCPPAPAKKAACRGDNGKFVKCPSAS